MQTTPQPEDSRRDTQPYQQLKSPRRQRDTLPQFGINFRKVSNGPQDQPDAQLTAKREYKEMVEQRITAPDPDEGGKTVMQLILEGEERKLLTTDEAMELRKKALQVDRTGVINWGEISSSKTIKQHDPAT